MANAPMVIRYTFEYQDADQTVLTYDIHLTPETMARIRKESDPAPAWAALELHQCPNCPLSTSDTPTCPAALALADAAPKLEGLVSHAPVRVRVTSKEREVAVNTSTQQALRSVLGLYMATSGCPVLGKFKPMARFHLPFSNREETFFRSAGAYLLGQFLLHHRGQGGAFSLEGLRALYEEVHEINANLARRIRGVATGDANINALVLLDLFAQDLPLSLDEHLESLSGIYDAYGLDTQG